MLTMGLKKFGTDAKNF